MDYLEQSTDLGLPESDPELFAMTLVLGHIQVLIQHGESDLRCSGDDSALYPHSLEAFLTRLWWKERRKTSAWRKNGIGCSCSFPS